MITAAPKRTTSLPVASSRPFERLPATGRRVLVLCHGHPELGAGGTERAAYSLFKRLRQDPRVTAAFFVARAEHQIIGHSAPMGAFRGRANEVLVAPPPVDPFTFQSLHYDTLKQLVEGLVDFFRPDVVHVHHFLYWGIEIFDLFSRAGVRVVATLHEYSAICAHYGQMVKADGRLCYAASPSECSACLSLATAGKFFVREKLIKRLLEPVDIFVSPSRFLQERYMAWGLPSERIRVIENVLDFEVAGSKPPARAATAARTVFGFFGQINPFKGLDILLEAASRLPESVRAAVELRVHGENKHYRGGAFAETIERLTAKTHDVVRSMGGYRNQDVLTLMGGCDWIVVPSVWWENSPVVIQEARMAGRPLILSDIGGMAEKARTGVDRLVPARNAAALADTLTEIAVAQARAGTPAKGQTAEVSRAASQISERSYRDHLALYGALA